MRDRREATEDGTACPYADVLGCSQALEQAHSGVNPFGERFSEMDPPCRTIERQDIGPATQDQLAPFQNAGRQVQSTNGLSRMFPICRGDLSGARWQRDGGVSATRPAHVQLTGARS